jgi:spore germination cell wall hydrolase CwlJ-like protein
MKREAFQIFSPVELMAGNSYGEARMYEASIVDEIREYIGVNQVVMNRVKSPRWPLSIPLVILQRAQFSWLNEGDPNSDAVWAFLKNKTPVDTYKRMMRYADLVLRGKVRDLTYGANHYMSRRLFESTPPAWAKEMIVTDIIGGHVFLTDGKL